MAVSASSRDWLAARPPPPLPDRSSVGEPGLAGLNESGAGLGAELAGRAGAFWSTGSPGEFKELLEKLETTQTMVPITPECLVKIVTGAVDYAGSFGFPHHTDYRHAARLFEGIDPSACPLEFTYGRDGKPCYFKGPHETHAQAEAIAQRVAAAGGHFTIALGPFDPDDLDSLEDEWDDSDTDDEIGNFDEWR